MKQQGYSHSNHHNYYETKTVGHNETKRSKYCTSEFNNPFLSKDESSKLKKNQQRSFWVKLSSSYDILRVNMLETEYILAINLEQIK